MPRTSSAPTGAVGKEALAYCTSCKMDLNHTIVSLKGDRIAKVHCLTCKKEHIYRSPKGITEPGTAKPKATRRKKKEAEVEAVSVEAEWEKLMATHREAPLKAYNTKGNFSLGDKIGHPVFGDGIVGKLIYPNKLEVIFRTDVKVLIHGGALSA
jgi:hypothetical protein